VPFIGRRGGFVDDLRSDIDVLARRRDAHEAGERRDTQLPRVALEHPLHGRTEGFAESHTIARAGRHPVIGENHEIVGA
jgi:hypothetical protein